MVTGNRNEMQSLLSQSKHTIRNIIDYLNRPWKEFTMEMDDCCSNFICSFGKNGWHHLIETYRQIEKEPDISVDKTVLYQYHSRFRPYGIYDFLPNGSVKFSPPWGVYPWGSFKDKNYIKLGNQHKTRCCGPSSLSLIKDEFNRMKFLYEKLKQEGYKPWSFGNNHISGIILEAADKRRRMLIVQGNHRLAALSVLGYESLPIRLFENGRRYLREKNVKEWHFVRTGECSTEDALTIFRLYFTENGHHIKGKIGL